MRPSSLLGCLWFMSFLPSIAACGGDAAEADIEIKGTDAVFDLGDATEGPVTCSNNTQCSGGEVCRDGFCRPVCMDNSECRNGFRCADFVCVPNDDISCDPACGASQVCVAGTCLSRECTAGARECAGDTLLICNASGTDREETDCTLDQKICTGDAATSGCTTRVCTPNDARCDAAGGNVVSCDARGASETTTACSEGTECLNGACIDPCADPEACDAVCEPNSVICSADGKAVRTCSADGEAVTEVSCTSGSVCVSSGSPAHCQPTVCAASTLGCIDDNTAFVCDATGTAKTQLPCAAHQYCDSGACREEVCAPSSVTCAGSAVVTCNALGSSATVEPCSSEATCASSTWGCSCVGGKCEVRACSPGTSRCAGNSTQSCNADGLAYGDLAACGSDQVCLDSACVPKACTPNSRECIGDTLVVCNQSGTSRGETDCKLTQDICTGTGAAATCTDRVCTPNATSCDSANTVLICDARGAAQTSNACAAGQYCEGGVCRNQVCEPSSVTCSANAVVTCNSVGSASTISQCPGDATCASSPYGCSCSGGACVQRICSPGSSRCAGNSIQTCNSDGLAYGQLTSCGDTHVCVDGSCHLRVCTAGARACVGDTLTVCNQTGTGETQTNCQSTQKYCSGTGAASSCTAWVCTPSTMTCNANDTAVLACDSRGASQTSSVCPVDEVCSNGECINMCAALTLYGDINSPDRVLATFTGHLGKSVLTFEIWVNVAAVTEFGRIFFTGALQMQIYSDSRYLVELYNPQINPGYPVGSGAVFSTQPAALGTWQHLSVQFDNGRLILHVDGVLQGTVETGFATMPHWNHANAAWNNAITAVGDFYGNPCCYADALHGSVAEFRISKAPRYGTASFTPSRSFTNDADTLLLWHLDEGNGATAHDSSGGGNDGAIEGGTWTTDFCR